MNQWGFYYDQTRCVSCKACTAACKSWNDDLRGDVNINASLSWLTSARTNMQTLRHMNTFPAATECRTMRYTRNTT